MQAIHTSYFKFFSFPEHVRKSLAAKCASQFVKNLSQIYEMQQAALIKARDKPHTKCAYRLWQ